ncbi:MAG: hypothetical protein ACFHU9_01715 [Fluviicola sp.]
MGKLKYNLILVIASSVIVASCQSKSSTGKTLSKEAEKNESLPYVETIYDGELVYAWIDDIASYDFDTSEFSHSKKPFQNIHDPNHMDTIRSYKSEKSEILFYYTPSKSILMDSDISDSQITLSEKIKIGVVKEVVFAVLDQQFKNDTLTIMEPDGYGINFELFFRDNHLNRIQFNSYID